MTSSYFDPDKVLVVEVSDPDKVVVAEVKAPGPPVAIIVGSSEAAATQLSELIDVDVGDKVNDSLLFYSASSQKFKADSTTTRLTLTDGGNF